MYAMLMLTTKLESSVRHKRWEADSSTRNIANSAWEEHVEHVFVININCIKLIIIGELFAELLENSVGENYSESMDCWR